MRTRLDHKLIDRFIRASNKQFLIAFTLGTSSPCPVAPTAAPSLPEANVSNEATYRATTNEVVVGCIAKGGKAFSQAAQILRTGTV